MYFHPKEIARVVDECGVRAVIGAAVIEQESGYTINFNDAMKKAESFKKAFDQKTTIIKSLKVRLDDFKKKNSKLVTEVKKLTKQMAKRMALTWCPLCHSSG